MNLRRIFLRMAFWKPSAGGPWEEPRPNQVYWASKRSKGRKVPIFWPDHCSAHGRITKPLSRRGHVDHREIHRSPMCPYGRPTISGPNLWYTSCTPGDETARHPSLAKFANVHGMTPAQVAPAWLLANDIVMVIPKTQLPQADERKCRRPRPSAHEGTTCRD